MEESRKVTGFNNISCVPSTQMVKPKYDGCLIMLRASAHIHTKFHAAKMRVPVDAVGDQNVVRSFIMRDLMSEIGFGRDHGSRSKKLTNADHCESFCDATK